MSDHSSENTKQNGRDSGNYLVVADVHVLDGSGGGHFMPASRAVYMRRLLILAVLFCVRVNTDGLASNDQRLQLLWGPMVF